MDRVYHFDSESNQIKLNIFEEQVFDNTTYTVCSIKFIKNNIELLSQEINVTFYPKKLNKNLIFEDNKYWLLGGGYSIK